MTTSERELVAALGEAIARRIGEPRYCLWFAAKTKFAWEDDQLVVGVPNHFYQEWLQSKYGAAVRAAAQEVSGRLVQVRFTIDPELFQAARQEQAAVGMPRDFHQDGTNLQAETDTGSTTATLPRPTVPSRVSSKTARRWHRLADFVVGPCNRVAHASAVSIVEAPSQGVNPLVLYGPVGTGKTHLAEGISAGLRKNYPEWRVHYVTAEEFTNRFVQAMRLNKLGAFRKHFRDCDVLLVDDLHFLARKPATQEEFLHTFDALTANGSQLVLTCDCHPRLTEEFSPELTDRLLGGAVWGLQPPDPATRLDILRAKAGRSEPPIPEEVLRYLAEHLRGNVRELEGALKSVSHFSQVSGRALDLSLAREALADLMRHAVRLVQLADIDRAVCRVLHLEAGSLQVKQRAWAVSHPRMLAIYLARKHTAAAYTEIGRHFGGRNHSTALAAEKKIRRWLQEDGQLVLGQRHLRLRDVIDLVERELQR